MNIYNYGQYGMKCQSNAPSTKVKSRMPRKLNSIDRIESKIVKKVRFEAIENEYFPEEVLKSSENREGLGHEHEISFD